MSTFDEFGRTYARLFGDKPPEDFIRAYGILCEAIYFGISKEDAAERGPLKRKKKSPGEHWPLHEWRLLPAKGEVDKALAQITQALRRWEHGNRVGRRVPRRRGDIHGQGGHSQHEEMGKAEPSLRRESGSVRKNDSRPHAKGAGRTG